MKSILLILSTGICNAQVTRKEILENRIKLITITLFNENEEKQQEVMEYYSVSGFDSAKHYDGQPAFTYKPRFDKQNRLIQLIRVDTKGREDEFHIFKYNRNDSSYTIEVVAHGAGTISFSRYNKNNLCFEEIFSGTDTVIYKHNVLGKIETVSMREEGRLLTMATTKFNSMGFPLSTQMVGDNSKIIYFKHNEKGLVAEEKYFSVENNKEALMEIRRYNYEYHK
jgi:hypothetical protein